MFLKKYSYQIQNKLLVYEKHIFVSSEKRLGLYFGEFHERNKWFQFLTHFKDELESEIMDSNNLKFLCCWPLNHSRVMGTNLLGMKTPLAPQYPWFCLFADSANCRRCNTVVFTTERNPHLSGPVQFKSLSFKGILITVNLVLSHLWSIRSSRQGRKSDIRTQIHLAFGVRCSRLHSHCVTCSSSEWDWWSTQALLKAAQKETHPLTSQWVSILRLQWSEVQVLV